MVCLLLGAIATFNVEVEPAKNKHIVSSVIKNSSIGEGQRTEGGRLLISNDVEISDCVINGTILIEGGARVLFDNVTIYVGYYMYVVYPFSPRGFIEVYDDSYVEIKNSRIIGSTYWPTYIFLYNDSYLVLENINTSNTMSMEIEVHDNAEISIVDSNITSYIDLRENARLHVEGSYGELQIFAHDDAMVLTTGDIVGNTYIEASGRSQIIANNFESYSLTVFLYDASTFTIRNSTVYDYIWAVDVSIVDAVDSQLRVLDVEDRGSITLYNTDVDTLLMDGSSELYVSGGYIGYAVLDWGGKPTPYSALGPMGTIENATVDTLITHSARILYLYGCTIVDMYYLLIFNGSFAEIYPSGWRADEIYANYIEYYCTFVNPPTIDEKAVVAIGLSKLITNTSSLYYIYIVMT